MISALLVSSLLGAGPASPGDVIREVQRAFLEDGVDRVSATRTHRVISRADGTLELQGDQPLKLSLQAITRGARCQTTMLSRLTMLGAPTTVRSLRGCDVEESWTNGPLGLEHAFTILRAPPGSGGFSLFVRVDGPWHHADDGGHVFKGPGASRSLRYGRAFVVRGAQRLPIEVVHVEGGLEVRVPAALADAPGAFPMEIDPVLTAELELDPSISFGPSPGADETPAIAVNNAGTALVVWADTRRQLGSDLFGARLTAGGTLGDPVGIPLSVASGHQLRPTVCGDGPDFLIAWDTPIDGGFQIHARQVSGAGVPRAEFVVANGFAPALASAGDAGINFLAYVDPQSKAQVIPISGTTVGTPVMRPVINDEIASSPAIAASNRGWFAAWETRPAGSPLASIRGMFSGSTSPVIVPVFDNANVTSPRRPTVALATVSADSEDAFVFWDEGLTVGGARVSQLSQTVTYSFNGSSPALARTSAALNALPTLGAFVAGPRLQLRDLNDGGLSSFPVGSSPRDLVLAANPKIVAAWTEAPRTESDVYGAVVSTSTGSTQGLLLSRAANAQRGPRVAISDNPNEGLAVWIEGTTTVVAARVREDENGLRVGTPFHVYESTQTIEQVDVAAMAVDPLFLVTWRHTQPSGIMGQLADTSSTKSLPFVLSAAGVNAGPAVTWDEGTGTFVVAWNQTAVGADVVTRTVTPAGVLSAVRTHATGPAVDVAISCLRGNCLLAWEKPTRDLAGLVIGSISASVFTRPTPAGKPAVAHDGTDFFLAWHSATGLSFARVDAANGVATNLSSGIATNGSAAVTGLSMASAIPPVLAWAELAPSELTTVYLQRLDFQAPRETVGPGFNPSVAIGSMNAQPSGALVYQRYLSTGYNAMRVFGKGFTYAPDGGYRDGGFDAGFDAGADAGSPDGGVDGGGADAGSDGGSPQDAGVDAGQRDAGVAGDGGVFMFETSGCSCRSGGEASLALFLAVFLTRRRSRARG